MWAACEDLLSPCWRNTQRTLQNPHLNLLLQNKGVKIAFSYFYCLLFSTTFLFFWRPGSAHRRSWNLKIHEECLFLLFLFAAKGQVKEHACQSFWQGHWVEGVELLTAAALNNETSPSALRRHQRWVVLAYGSKRQLRALRLGKPRGSTRCHDAAANISFFFFFFCNLPTPPPPPSGWTCSRTLLANEDWQVYSLRRLKIDQTIFRLVLPFFGLCLFFRHFNNNEEAGNVGSRSNESEVEVWLKART